MPIGTSNWREAEVFRAPTKGNRHEPTKGDEVRLDGKLYRIVQITRIPGGNFLARVEDMAGQSITVELKKQARAA